MPTVSVIEWPGPSGLLRNSSRVIPSFTSARYCSVERSVPSMVIRIDSRFGASNNPGMSSVKRIRLMSLEPLLLIVIVTPTSCCL